MTRSRLWIAALAASLIAPPVAMVAAPHAAAQFGGIVYDPRNHAQNLLTAARTLQSINNQVRQLSNETRMLLNQARHLERLPDSLADELNASLRDIERLLSTAEGLAYDVNRVRADFDRLFPAEHGEGTDTAALLAEADAAWRQAREGFRHSLEVQAGVMTELNRDAARLEALMALNHSAAGQLEAAQAGNELTALAAKQSMQLQTLLAASARAEALENARRLSERERARVRRNRFLGDGTAYSRSSGDG